MRLKASPALKGLTLKLTLNEWIVQSHENEVLHKFVVIASLVEKSYLILKLPFAFEFTKIPNFFKLRQLDLNPAQKI